MVCPRIKWKNIWLKHHTPAHFGTTQWGNAKQAALLYLIYRCLVFLYFFSFFFYNIFHDYGNGNEYMLNYYFLYLTNWTYLVALSDIALQLITAIVLMVRSHRGVKPVVPVALYQVTWISVIISHTMEPFVTLLYWAGVYPQIDHATTGVAYSDLHLHLFTTIYTLADLTIHKLPRRVLHVLYPVIYGLTYMLFTLIYYLSGGRDPKGNTGIYPILDWAQPGLTIGVVFASLAAVFLLHTATWAIVSLRVKLHQRLMKKRAGVSDGASGGNASTSRALSGPGGSGSQHDKNIDVDIGEGAQGGDSSPRSRDTAQAFDNKALEVDEADITSRNQSDSSLPPVA